MFSIDQCLPHKKHRYVSELVQFGKFNELKHLNLFEKFFSYIGKDDICPILAILDYLFIDHNPILVHLSWL